MFLDLSWLIPIIPALSFVIILFFGKRLPKKGAEVGIAAVGATFLLACGTAYQWIQRVSDSEGGHGGGKEEALGVLGALGRSVGRLAAESGEHSVVEPVTHGFTWLDLGGIRLGAGVQIDGLAVAVMFVVTLISLLVHVYSTEYMRDDRRYTHYYAALSLFTASMLVLVVADNPLQLLVGGELGGVCSFMLIGHWWEEQPNSNAALKAFLTTRTGDIGLLAGVIMTFFIVQRATGTGSFSIVEVNRAAADPAVGNTLVMWCALALLLGIMGKSGQFPLHTWLPDAMAGPTPVSALIHAATMVVAGVYLGARVYPVFWHGLSIGGHAGWNWMAVVGGVTVLVGAALAFVQDDIKKVLAYSTISQLGYMVMALGVGAWGAAVFHLFTHAFFKANLFLGAGSISHSASHHSFDMKKDMGGLRKVMPQTFATFVIGSLALAGIPPLAGFWSKDEIVALAHKNGYTAFLVVGLIGALMTAAYMTRCVYLTFFGEFRGGHVHDEHAAVAAHHDDHGDEHAAALTTTHAVAHDDHGGHHDAPHESPRILTTPLWILSFFSVFIGLLNFPGLHLFEDWSETRYPEEFFATLVKPEFKILIAVISVAIALTGIAGAWAYYHDRLPFLRGLSERNAFAGAVRRTLVNKLYLDHLYENVIVGGIKGAIARGVYWIDRKVIDNVLNFAGKAAVGLGGLTYRFADRKVVDGFVNGIAVATGEAGGAVRRVQTGRLQLYALMLAVAVVVFAAVLWIFT
ncbi:MAG: NADH-quinone oxidoreductase subunit L [Actinomycetota bacterium]